MGKYDGVSNSMTVAGVAESAQAWWRRCDGEVGGIANHGVAQPLFDALDAVFGTFSDLVTVQAKASAIENDATRTVDWRLGRVQQLLDGAYTKAEQPPLALRAAVGDVRDALQRSSLPQAPRGAATSDPMTAVQVEQTIQLLESQAGGGQAALLELVAGLLRDALVARDQLAAWILVSPPVLTAYRRFGVDQAALFGRLQQVQDAAAPGSGIPAPRAIILLPYLALGSPQRASSKAPGGPGGLVQFAELAVYTLRRDRQDYEERMAQIQRDYSLEAVQRQQRQRLAALAAQQGPTAGEPGPLPSRDVRAVS
jgi:hypothetical protein